MSVRKLSLRLYSDNRNNRNGAGGSDQGFDLLPESNPGLFVCVSGCHGMCTMTFVVVVTMMSSLKFLQSSCYIISFSLL